MARWGGKKTARRVRKKAKAFGKPSKVARKTRRKPALKKHVKARVHRQKVSRRRHVPKRVSKKVILPQPELSAEEKRPLEKLPEAKPLKLDRQVVRVFGHKIDPARIRNAAVEAYSKRTYGIDDIQVENYIRDSEWDNLMTKIGILDRIEEQLNLMYPHIDVVRKNKISLELYLRK